MSLKTGKQSQLQSSAKNISTRQNKIYLRCRIRRNNINNNRNSCKSTAWYLQNMEKIEKIELQLIL
jgi:hypothetical protein